MKRKKGSFWFSIFMIVLLSFSTIQVNADMDISQVDVTAADEIKKTTVHTYGANTWAYSSLAKGPNDELYVAHMINDSEIAVKRWNGATWEPFTSVTKIATADTSLAGPIKLVADANGNLHLAFKFYDGSGVNSYRGVKYGYFNGGTKSWSFTEIEGYSDPNGWKNFDDPSLAVDSSGAVHMVYLYDEAGPHNHYVKYATNQSGTWKIGTMVTSSGGIDELKSPQIVIDNRNNVHVTYIKEDQQNSYYGNVYFTTKKASDTSFPAATKLINSTGDLQDYWSYPLTLDSNGSVYIAYSSLTTSYIVTNASGSWRTEQIYVDHTRITGPLSVHFVGPDIYLLMESWKSDNSEVYFFAMKKTATGWEKGTKNISPAEPGVTSEITYSVDSQGNYMLVMLDRGLRIISSLSGSSAAMGLTTVATPTYSVSYDGNGHTSGNTPTDSKQYKQGDQVTVVGNTGNLQKTGHTFAGWNTASNGTGTSYSPGSSFTMPSNDVILYAKWIQSTYTVSFNSNGGSAVAPVTTNPNTTISAPTPPTRTGYTFNGWFKEASLTSEWNFATDKVTQDTTLYAKWTINQYTVSFNSNGGSAVAPVTTNYNTTISAPTPPTRTGYTFNGWYKEAGLTTGWNFATDKVIQHTTLYAKWTINQYTVSFNSNGGSAVTPVTTNYDTTISAPTPPTRAGYTFNGWFKDAGLSTVWNFATDKVTQDTTLYAKWTINQYTVSFNSNGGSAVAPVTTNYNTSISAPTPPTRTGYTFNGWFKEAGLMTEWNFATDKVTQDTTLFAKWTINQYTVSFNSNGGSAIAPVTTNYNTSITAPTPPTRTGYSFNGWFKEAGLSTVWNFATDKVTQDTTLYAKWTINQYTVSFNSNGGSAVTPVTTNYNTSISDPTPPTRTGYSFNGWFKEAGLTTEWNFATDKVTQDTTLYAKWTINQYTVSFDVDGGNVIASQTVNHGDKAVEPAQPTKTGFTFAGWYTDNKYTTQFDFANTSITSNKTIYVKWSINQYTVSFNSNGGSAVTAVITNYNTSITAPTPPTRTGYTFNGWFKDAGLTTEWDFATDKVTQDTALHAKWTINQYTVSFNSNGGSGVTQITTNYNTSITAPTPPTRTGYTFNGWFKEAGLMTEWNFATDKITQDTTLFAKWTINQYTVSFNSNGGSAVAPVTTNYNTSISAPTPPTRTGYTFNGWFKEAGLITEWDFATDKVMQDTTLFAKWTINQYTVSFNSNGGSAVAPVTTNYNTSISAPTPPTRTGYTFNGWFKEAGLMTEWNFATEKVTQDTTLFAKWTINQYTVSFNSNGGSAVTPVTTNYNTSISAPTPPTRTGYTFNGWFKEAGLITEWAFATDKAMQDTTLFAKWTINQYTVSFNSNGGSAVAPVTTNYNTSISAPTPPTRTGYTFNGWFKEAGLMTEWNFATDKVTQDTTLFAKWTINQYTVSFNSNGGSAVTPVATNYNTSISAPTPPTRTGYTFNGWFKEAGLMTEWNFATDKVTQDTTLYAKWTINQYLVRFDSNGGRSIAPVIANYNTTISPTSTTRTGYTFNGWYKEVGMNTEWKFATDKVTHDITLYANWTINEYTVSFNSNGGSVIAPVTTHYNATITTPTPPTRAGYIFKGWYKDAEFKTAWDFSTDKITNNTTLFASWTEIVTPDPEPILYTHSAYINGYPDNTFRPEQKVTRAQMAVMLMKNLGLNDVTEKGEYNDVLETHWAYKEIMLAKQREIMFGIGSSFNPNDYITRAQMATIVYRWLKKECSNNSLAFEQCSTLVQKANTTYSDIKSDNWAAEAILAIKHFKIMEGYPDGSFKPNTHLTRAQAVKVLNRLFKRGPLEGDYNPTFKDVPKNHWAFKEIEEAARDHQYIISSDNKEVFVEE